MNSHRQIIDLWPDRAAFARELGVKYQTARGWYIRNSIPPEYWCGICHAAKERGLEAVTTDLLATIKDGERAKGAEAAA